MPTKHNYIVMVGKDEQINQEVTGILLDYYKPIIETEITKALQNLCVYKDQIAAIVIDDSMGQKDIRNFLSFCIMEQLDTQMPMFLLDGTEDDELYNEAVSLKIDEVIRKPYRIDILKTRVLNLTELFRHKYRLQWLVDTQTKELRESIEILNHMRMEVLESLGTLVEFRSFESGEHIYRVHFITELLMREFQKCYPEYNISDEMIPEICMASILHDIGKISVSDTILNKPGRLTDDEFEQMKKHTEYGCEILKHFKGLYTDDTYSFYYDVIRYHHEKWDGKGYPDGLKGNEIPIWAQIVSVADIYDALTSTRVYKPPYDHQTAVKMMFGGECGVINPDVLECFLHIEDKIMITSQKNQKISNKTISNIQDNNLVLHNLERERAYHRAYTELLSQSFFEFDSEYRTLEHFNVLGRTGTEHFKPNMFSEVHPDDIEKLKKALKFASAKDPIIKIEIRVSDELTMGEYVRYLVTIRTTWDIYTNKRLGGVGKMEKIPDRF